MNTVRVAEEESVGNSSGSSVGMGQFEQGGVWESWNKNKRHRYNRLYRVSCEAELASCLAQTKGSVRMLGQGYSSADICAGTETLLDMSAMNQILHFDEERLEVRVQPGASLAELCEALEARGWTLPCLPDITGVSLGGALATGTHGTGREGHLLSGYLVACRLVTASGDVLVIDEGNELMDAVRVSVGVLGIFSELTFRCVPAYTLHLQEGPMHDEQWLRDLPKMEQGNDFLRLLWLPHTDHAYVIRGNRVDAQEAGEEMAGPWWLRYRRTLSAIFYKWTYRWPRLTVWANQMLFWLFFRGKKEHWGTLYGATVTKKRGSTMELGEWTVARSRFPALFAELKACLNDKKNNAYVHVPMDIRFIAEDNTWLSYGFGEGCVTVGCVCRDSENADKYEAFDAVEKIFLKYGGRPHWAKHFEAKAADLAPLYPRWEDFQSLRRELDPQGRFLNDYLKDVMGA